MLQTTLSRVVLLQLLRQLKEAPECLAGTCIRCLSIQAHAIADVALIGVQAEWGVDGKHTLN
eukprot:8715266-Lingulodinium_polyedra.AAC.1